MNGIDNLIPFNKMTEEQQREIASKGGKASQEAAKKRKTLKEELLLLLGQDDNQTNVTVSLIKKALTGDTKAFEVIRDTIGEKPKEQHEIGNIDDKPLQVDLKQYTLEQLKGLIKDEDKGTD